jgi:hypothetical protein
MILIAVAVACQQIVQRNVDRTKARWHIHTPGASALEENRHEDPRDALWGMVQLLTDDLIADVRNTFRG